MWPCPYGFIHIGSVCRVCISLKPYCPMYLIGILMNRKIFRFIVEKWKNIIHIQVMNRAMYFGHKLITIAYLNYLLGVFLIYIISNYNIS